MLTTGVVIAAIVIIRHVTPFVNDHRVIPLIRVRGVIGNGYFIEDITFIVRTGIAITRLPVNFCLPIEDRVVIRSAAAVIPKRPGIQRRISDIENFALSQGQAHVEGQRAALRFFLPAIIFVDLIDPRTVFHLGYHLSAGADLGPQADIDFKLIIEPAVIIAERSGEVAIRIRYQRGVRIVEEGV